MQKKRGNLSLFDLTWEGNCSTRWNTFLWSFSAFVPPPLFLSALGGVASANEWVTKSKELGHSAFQNGFYCTLFWFGWYLTLKSFFLLCTSTYGMFICILFHSSLCLQKGFPHLSTSLYYLLFSCPEQLNRWPCHWLTNWLTHSVTFTFAIQRAILETCYHWDIWSEWWGDMTSLQFFQKS